MTTLRTKWAASFALTLLMAASAFAAPGWLGVSLGDINTERVTALKLKEERGVEIMSVAKDSPAAQAGLKEKDVVLEFNGQRVDGTEQLARLVRETAPGRTARLLISRDGATQTVNVKVGEKRSIGDPSLQVRIPRIEIPEIHMNPDIQVLMRTSRLGIEGQTLTRQLGDFFGVPDGEGVLISSVDKDSPAEKAGLKAGDVITRIEGQKIAGMKDLRTALRDKAGKTSLPITLYRNKREMNVTAAIERRERGALHEDFRRDLREQIRSFVVEHTHL